MANFHRITLRSPNDSPLSNNLQVLLDGQPVLGLKAVKLGAAVGSLIEVQLSMIAAVDADIMAGLKVQPELIDVTRHEDELPQFLGVPGCR